MRGRITYLRDGELKPKLRTIIVMQDRPKSIFLQCLAHFPYSDSDLRWKP